MLPSLCERYDLVLHCLDIGVVFRFEVGIVLGHGLALMAGKALDLTIGNVVAPQDGVEEVPPGVEGDIPLLLNDPTDSDGDQGIAQLLHGDFMRHRLLRIVPGEEKAVPLLVLQGLELCG
jgi:hypothetical protein